MVQRLVYRSRHSYATKSNQHRIVKTPGGKKVDHTMYTQRKCTLCHPTDEGMQGGPLPDYKRARLSRNLRTRNLRTVNRAYGGVLAGSAVRERIIRAFLVEEKKIGKKVLKLQKAKEKVFCQQSKS